MTLPRVVRLLLMLAPSLRRVPLAPVASARSEPARSTNEICDTVPSISNSGAIPHSPYHTMDDRLSLVFHWCMTSSSLNTTARFGWDSRNPFYTTSNRIEFNIRYDAGKRTLLAFSVERPVVSQWRRCVKISVKTACDRDDVSFMFVAATVLSVTSVTQIAQFSETQQQPHIQENTNNKTFSNPASLAKTMIFSKTQGQLNRFHGNLKAKAHPRKTEGQFNGTWWKCSGTTLTGPCCPRRWGRWCLGSTWRPV